MPSVMKAPAEVSPRALREVDRLNENPENLTANVGGESLELSSSGSYAVFGGRTSSVNGEFRLEVTRLSSGYREHG